MMGVDPLYIVLGFAFLAVGVIVYVRAQREQRSKQSAITPKGWRPPKDPPPKATPILAPGMKMPPSGGEQGPISPPIPASAVKDKAARLEEIKRMRDAGTISQLDYDTAKIKILFER